MEIEYGNGPTKYGPGVSITLTGNEVALAISTWLVAHGVNIQGPRTITVNGDLCEEGHLYVDPSGMVVMEGKEYSGRGSRAADSNEPYFGDPKPFLFEP